MPSWRSRRPPTKSWPDSGSERLDNGVVAETEKILRRADLVKFAKYQPGIPEHEETMVVVHDVVDKTKLVAMTPVAEPQRIGAGHVGS